MARDLEAPEKLQDAVVENLSLIQVIGRWGGMASGAFLVLKALHMFIWSFRNRDAGVMQLLWIWSLVVAEGAFGLLAIFLERGREFKPKVYTGPFEPIFRSKFSLGIFYCWMGGLVMGGPGTYSVYQHNWTETVKSTTKKKVLKTVCKKFHTTTDSAQYILLFFGVVILCVGICDLLVAIFFVKDFPSPADDDADEPRAQKDQTRPAKKLGVKIGRGLAPPVESHEGAEDEPKSKPPPKKRGLLKNAIPVIHVQAPESDGVPDL